jgi:hypothetical protein
VLSIPASAQEAQQTQDSAQQTQTTDTDVSMPKVFISEINWAGSELSQADEWLEIYNADSTNVDLGGWVLTGCASSGNAIALEEGTILNAGDSLLISNYDLGSDKTTLTVQPNLVTASVSLSNSAQLIMLVMPDGTVVDTVGDGATPIAGSTNPKTSMERDALTLEWLSSTTSINLSLQTQFGTPGVFNIPAIDTYDEIQEVDSIEEQQDITTEETTVQETDQKSPIDTTSVTETQTTSDVSEACHLILNEFVSNPNDNEQEWIEIFNPCDSTIDLSNIVIRDATLKSTAFEQTTIDPGAYAVITDPNGQLNNDGDTIELVNADQEVIDSIIYGNDLAEPKKGYSLAINDQGIWESTNTQTPGSKNIISSVLEVDEVIEPEIVTETSDSAEIDTSSDQATAEETEDSTSDTAQQEKTDDTTIEDAETQIELTSFEARTIILNEIVSDPADGDVEWIELYNPQTTSIDLTGWTIIDASEKSTTLDGLSIASDGYLVIENPKGKLNNDGDCVTLLDPTGNSIDQMSYGTEEVDEPNKGESLAFDGSTWITTTAITKNAINNLIYEEETSKQASGATSNDATTTSNNGVDTKTQQKTVSNSEQTSAGNNTVVSDDIQTHTVVAIAQTPKVSTTTSTTATVKSSTTTQKTSISGIVTAIPGTFGSQVAFIEGSQLYFYYADWPMLELGDIVKISGEISESRGENRIKISDIRDIEISGHTELEATTILINELSDIKDGTLITVEGEVLVIQDTKLTLKDSTGQITVVANTHEGMNWDTAGSKLKITGIVRTVSGEQRLYPRNMQDVQTIQETVNTNDAQTPLAISNTTDFTPWIGGGLLTLSLVGCAYYFMRRRSLETVQIGA